VEADDLAGEALAELEQTYGLSPVDAVVPSQRSA
jgi:hypothetical protein